jgi:UDP-3-O-[3-hydroxymyristoyl] N-acetylglucosamine deacetylase
MTPLATTAQTVRGIGLITGLSCTVDIAPGAPGTGIVFVVKGIDIPARVDHVLMCDRGVTLGIPGGPTLSIVEHFLSACAVANVGDIRVTVQGAPELPLLDGSASGWLDALQPFARPLPQTVQPLPHALRVTDAEGSYRLTAMPHPHLSILYAVHFDHPGLHHRWVLWDAATDDPVALMQAGTFGFVRELPVLQARGLAKGVSEENTLGLTDDGGYTRPLRFADEPIYHKVLDLLGDLMLSGVNPLTVGMRVVAVNAGHALHVGLAKKLHKLS